MNLSDTFYVALCMTVLILGVVYWFWTQSQYMQRKLNLLENIVYEMKSTLGHSPPAAALAPAPAPAAASLAAASAPASATAIAPMEDEDDDLHAAFHEEVSGPVVEEVTSPLLSIRPMEEESHVMDDLQPGGVGSGIKEVIVPDTAVKGSVLDSMTLKELRRLAEQKGISGSRTMRKQELIDAIRAQPVVNPFEAAAALEHAASAATVTPFEAAEGSDDIISTL